MRGCWVVMLSRAFLSFRAERSGVEQPSAVLLRRADGTARDSSTALGMTRATSSPARRSQEDPSRDEECAPLARRARGASFAPAPPISEPDRLRKTRGSSWPIRRDNSPERWAENRSKQSGRFRQTDRVVWRDFSLRV